MRSNYYEARLASDAAARSDAYRLRYDCYRAGGFIDERADKTFSDDYDTTDNACTVVICQDGRPAASVRTSVFRAGDARRSPGRSSFPAEIERELAGGFIGVEVTRMVRSPAFEMDQGLVLLLYRVAGFLGIEAGVDVFFAAVRANHVPFYRRFGYAEVAAARPYPGLRCPMQLLKCSRRRFEALCTAYPAIDPFTESSENLDALRRGGTARLSIVGRPGTMPSAPGRGVWRADRESARI